MSAMRTIVRSLGTVWVAYEERKRDRERSENNPEHLPENVWLDTSAVENEQR